MAAQAQSTSLLQTPALHQRFTAFATRPVQRSTKQGSRCQAVQASRRVLCRAQDQATPSEAAEAAEPQPEIAKSTETSSTRPKGDWVAVIAPEDFPKGIRKEVRADGIDVLMFWYRNEIFAIEARSPAEGAYSEGFLGSRLNQDYCIACPTTGSLFDFRTGEIKDWYPSNFVLRTLTPQSTCRNLRTYPVRLEQDAILIDVSAEGQRSGGRAAGGAMPATGNDNVYSVEPSVRIQEEGEGIDAAAVATTVVSITGAAALLVAGTALFKYWDSDIGLYAFWAAYAVGGIVALTGKVKF